MRTAASQPPEARGLARDGIRLLVATPDGLRHAAFADLPRFLTAGDLLVVNTSATIPAAVDGRRADGRPVTVDFSTELDDGCWLAELRESSKDHARVLDGIAGETIALPGSLSVSLLYRYPEPDSDRLWATTVNAPPEVKGDLRGALVASGRPIRYSYVPDPWPLEAYQTVFSADPGSAEMPSAGRPFTGNLVARLIAGGVLFAPITLHAGVASLETHEPPLPERYRVPELTARLVNLTKESGHRVIAVGTTCTRAIESAADARGRLSAEDGWTDLVLGHDRPARVVNGLVTGWHDPEASHLALLQAVAGTTLVRAAYAEADRTGYLGHEFGDSCLLLPPLSRRSLD